MNPAGLHHTGHRTWPWDNTNETTVTTEAGVGTVEALAAANRRMGMAVTERTANRNLGRRPLANGPALARNKLRHSPPDNPR